MSVDDHSTIAPIPTVTIQDLDEASRKEGQGKGGAQVPMEELRGEIIGQVGIPGAIPAAPLTAIPDWVSLVLVNFMCAKLRWITFELLQKVQNRMEVCQRD